MHQPQLQCMCCQHHDISALTLTDQPELRNRLQNCSWWPRNTGLDPQENSRLHNHQKGIRACCTCTKQGRGQLGCKNLN